MQININQYPALVTGTGLAQAVHVQVIHHDDIDHHDHQISGLKSGPYVCTCTVLPTQLPRKINCILDLYTVHVSAAA